MSPGPQLVRTTSMVLRDRRGAAGQLPARGCDDSAIMFLRLCLTTVVIQDGWAITYRWLKRHAVTNACARASSGGARAGHTQEETGNAADLDEPDSRELAIERAPADTAALRIAGGEKRKDALTRRRGAAAPDERRGGVLKQEEESCSGWRSARRTRRRVAPIPRGGSPRLSTPGTVMPMWCAPRVTA